MSKFETWNLKKSPSGTPIRLGKSPKVKGGDTEEAWDNEDMIKGLAEGDEDWSDVAIEVLKDSNELKSLTEFLKILKQKGWL